jgi:hypothetical protein
VLLTISPTSAAAGPDILGQQGPASTSDVDGGAAGVAAAAGGGSTQQQQQQQQQAADDLGLLGQVGVLEGIKLIAGGLEALLQRLSVAATNVTVRLEVPSAAVSSPAAAHRTTAAAAAAAVAGAEVLLHIEGVHFCDSTPAVQAAVPAGAAAAAGGGGGGGFKAAQQFAAGTTQTASTGISSTATQQQQHQQQELIKCVTVKGLTLELLELSGDSWGEAPSDLGASHLFSEQQAAASAVNSRSDSGGSSNKRSSYLNSTGGRAAAAAAAAPVRQAACDNDAQQQQQDASGDDAGMGGLLLAGPHQQQGLDIRLELRLAWAAAAAAAAATGAAGSSSAGSSSAGSSSAGSSGASRITVEVTTSGVFMALQPWQLPLIKLLSDAAAAAASSSTPSAAAAAASKGNSCVDGGAAAAAAAAACSSQPEAADSSSAQLLEHRHEQQQQHHHHHHQQQQQQQQQHRDWGQRSFVEELFFPHCENLVANSLCLSSSGAQGTDYGVSSMASSNSNISLLGSGFLGDAGGALYKSVITAADAFCPLAGVGSADGGSGSSMYSSTAMYNSCSSGISPGSAVNGLHSVYQDARSVFSSIGSNLLMRSGVGGGGTVGMPQSDSLYHSVFQGAGSSSISSNTVGGGGSSSSSSPWQQQQQQPPPAAADWFVRVSVPTVVVNAYYHAPTCAPAAAAAAAAAEAAAAASCFESSSAAAARFVLQTGGLLLSYDVSGHHTNHLSVKCYKLECYEYLPGSWTAADRQLTGLSPAELGSVPRVVVVGPAGQGGAAGSSSQQVRNDRHFDWRICYSHVAAVATAVGRW